MIDRLMADSISVSTRVRKSSIDKKAVIERNVGRVVYWIKRCYEWIVFYSIWTHAPPVRS